MLERTKNMAFTWQRQSRFFFNTPLLVLEDIKHSRKEQEERRFWEKHDSSEYVDWKKAESVVLPNLKPTTKTISLHLPQHLLDSIKSAAHSRDVPYQSLIKVWLQEKLHDQ